MEIAFHTAHIHHGRHEFFLRCENLERPMRQLYRRCHTPGFQIPANELEFCLACAEVWLPAGEHLLRACPCPHEHL